MKENMKNISVIGLGSMGYGIAQSLIRSGYMVYGQDKNLLQQKKIVEEGGQVGEKSYGNLDAVIIVVLNEAQTKEIIFGSDGIAAKLNKILLLWCVQLCLQTLRKKWQLCVKIKSCYI